MNINFDMELGHKLEQKMEHEHEVVIEKEGPFVLTKKSLTDNSIAYNVYILKENGQPHFEFMPSGLRAARRVYNAMLAADYFACYLEEESG